MKRPGEYWWVYAVLVGIALLEVSGCTFHLHVLGTYQDKDNPADQGVTIVIPEPKHERENND